VVNRVILTVCWLLPVYPEQRTSSYRPGWSGWCHKQTLVALPSHVTRSANQASVTVFSMTCPGQNVGHRGSDLGGWQIKADL
jgi:hypothetical protein